MILSIFRSWTAFTVVLVITCVSTAEVYAGTGLTMTAAQSNEPIEPVPETTQLNEKKVKLGKKLFFDPRLSKSDKMACVNCHQLGQGGDDGLARSVTNTGEPDLTNAPTVFNAALNFRQTWRGQFRTLEEQAEADLRNPRHGNIDWPELLPKLKSDPDYVKQFNASYSNGITRESVLDALATFERSLITPNASFDRFLKGDNEAIGYDALKGYMLFKTYGCVACHQGVNVGGNMFQRVGVHGEFPFNGRSVTKADLGRFAVTGASVDRFVFKVPSLRNVAVTAPYFHDGSTPTLEDAIRIMGRIQIGVKIPDEDVVAIAAFLVTLTGEYQGKSLLSGTGGK